MQTSHTKLIDLFLVGLASLILMAYGWYLGQLHQSGYDVAGIFLFITGLIGLLLAFLIRYFTRNYSWYNTWYSNLLTGVLSCTIIFAMILLLSRLHG
jgi:hypothetical protein